jgi:hypothetical protein
MLVMSPSGSIVSIGRPMASRPKRVTLPRPSVVRLGRPSPS